MRLANFSILFSFALTIAESSEKGDLYTPRCGRISSTTSFLSGPGIRTPVDVPWHASVTRRNELIPDVTIPALLVAPSLVLTRAYHFTNKDTNKFVIFPPEEYFVALGTKNFGDPAHFVDNNNTQVLKITHIRIHPNYIMGKWTSALNDLALLHLSSSVNPCDLVQPVCLPNSSDLTTIEKLRTMEDDPSQEELSLTGWNRQISENMFLRLKIQSQLGCHQLWDAESETHPVPFNESRIWCAKVGTQNNHTTCIHNDVGAVAAVRSEVDSYFLSGIVRELYSSNRERKCLEGALYYFDVLPPETFKWIENNINCGSQHFTCSSGQCVPLSELCDATPDCLDSSDEDPAFCRGRNSCKLDQFECGVYGDCIPIKLTCNGALDCGNGEDEEDCDKRNQYFILSSIGTSFFVLCLISSGIILWRRQLNRLKSEIRNLTKKEVNEFVHGITPQYVKLGEESLEKGIDLTDPDYHYINDPIQSLPWKKEHEISMKRLRIGQEINRGRFGIVYKATLINADGSHIGGNGNVDVAIKTHVKSVRIMEFKTLLCELKIQSYLGEKENPYVLKFIGACTQNIKKREVYMVVEYCPKGNLRDFLVENGKYFINSVDPSGTQFQDYVLHYSQYGYIDAFDLLLWATQISCGMEFLASQNVIHGDLAARNILLMEDLNIKISDFGLSRKFGGSGIYIKSTNEPIPWKWLAPEALLSCAFSEKSDIWAFGVLLWEIFSLGQDPHSGVECNEKFLSGLAAGERLAKPSYASDEMMKLMSFCWKNRPEDRPRFKTLRANLTVLLQEYKSEKYQRRLSDDLKVSIDEYIKVI